MLTFLFWNLNGKNLLPSVVRLAAAHDVDILILAECGAALTPAAMLLALNPAGEEAKYFFAPGNCERIRILTRFPDSYAAPISESDHYTMRRMALPGRKEVLVVAAPLQSLREASEKTLYGETLLFSEEIRRTEEDIGHTRTILVGDLNMNPFEDGIVSAMGLNGVMTKQIARQKSRTVLRKKYPFFYNRPLA